MQANPDGKQSKLSEQSDKASKVFQELDKVMAQIRANSSSISAVLAGPSVLQYDKSTSKKVLLVLGWCTVWTAAWAAAMVAPALILPAALAESVLVGFATGAVRAPLGLVMGRYLLSMLGLDRLHPFVSL